MRPMHYIIIALVLKSLLDGGLIFTFFVVSVIALIIEKYYKNEK